MIIELKTNFFYEVLYKVILIFSERNLSAKGFVKQNTTNFNVYHGHSQKLAFWGERIFGSLNT